MKPDPITTDAINIAHIRVAGIGGLGLVAMAGVVAWYVPSIGVATLLALAGGLTLAFALIRWRRTH